MSAELKDALAWFDTQLKREFRTMRGDDRELEPIIEAARRVAEADLEYVLTQAITTDGAHHKQWWLEHIAGTFGIDLPDHEPGIAP